MEVNLDVPMLFVYQRIFTVTDTMIVPMKVTRLIVQRLRVPIINFYVQMAVRIERQNALRNRSCAMERETVTMEQTRKLLAQHLHVQL